MALTINEFKLSYSNDIIYRKLLDIDSDYQYVINPGIILNNSSGYIWSKIECDIELDELLNDVSINFKCDINDKLKEQVFSVLKYLIKKKCLIIENTKTCNIVSEYEIDEIFNTNLDIKCDYNTKSNLAFDPIADIDLVVTKGCNFSCKHCFVSCSSELINNEVMNLEQWKMAIDKLCGLGLTSVNITGGEPFTYKDVVPLMDYINDKNLNIFLLTNGFLLNENIIEHISKFKKIKVQVSVDGASTNTHDLMRNTLNSFDRICENIKLLRQYNIPVVMATTLSTYNYKEVLSGKLINLAKELNVNVLGVTTTLVKVGRANDNWDICPEIEQSLEVIEYLKKEKEKEYPFNISIGAPPALVEETVENIEQSLPKCKRGINSCSLLSDGSVIVCTDFSEVKYEKYNLGNLLKEDITDIWKKAKHIRKERLNGAEKVKGICSICKDKKRCGGSCRADAYSTYKDINAPYPFCQNLHEKGLFPKDKINTNSVYINFGE